jgi:hypothetical protein
MEKSRLLQQRIADLEAERTELYQFLDLLTSAGLRLNDLSLKDALQKLRKIGNSKFVWPSK